MLILPIKKKWFDMIASGDKKEEYRKINQYYTTRFGNLFLQDYFKDYGIEEWYNQDLFYSISEQDFKPREICFRNGYRKDSPKIKCLCGLKIGQGKEEWGAEKGKEYYILEILEVSK